MGFTKPNDPAAPANAAAFADQAEPDKVDWDILAAGMGGVGSTNVHGQGPTGVESGCAVTAQGTPNMTVAVAAGVVRIGGRRVTVSSGNVTITAAHGTLPRIDLITVDTAAAKAVVTGIANANPVTPDIPASKVCLAEVYVPAADTAINTNQITDKRVLIDAPWSENVKWYGALGNGANNDAVAIQAAIDAAAVYQGIVLFPSGYYMSASTIDWKMGVKLLGIGNRGDGTLQKPTLRYTGSPVATGFVRYTASSETEGMWAEGIAFNANTLADYCVEVNATGSVDQGFFFEDCSFQAAAKSGLYIGQLVTNFYFRHCRWDVWFDYAIEFANVCTSASFQDGTMDAGAANVAKGYIHFNMSLSTGERTRFSLRSIRFESGSATVPNITEGYIRVTEPDVDTGSKFLLELELDGIWAALPVAQHNQIPVVKTRRLNGTAGNKAYIRVTGRRCEFNQRIFINDGVSDVDLGASFVFPDFVWSVFDTSPGGHRGPVYNAAVQWWRNQTFAINPPAGHVSLYAEGEALKTKDSAGVVSAMHPQAHVLTGADHTLSGLTAGQVYEATAATTAAFVATKFARGGTVLDPAAARFVMVWRAPFACTVTNVRGHRKGGTGATINARKNQLSDHLATDLSLTSADAWMDGGAVQNTAYAAGDDLEIEIASVAGAVTELAIQVDYTRP